MGKVLNKAFSTVKHPVRAPPGGGVAPVLIEVVKVEHVAVKVSENVFLVEVLLAVQGELLAAHGTLPPVRLHVALKAALLKVRRENNLTQRAALVDISPETDREKEGHDWLGVKSTAAPD